MKKRFAGALVLGGTICFAAGTLYPTPALRAGVETSHGDSPAIDGCPHGPWPGAMLDRLKLTRQQNAAVRNVLFDEHAAIRTLRQQEEALHKRSRDKVSAILTKDQRRLMKSGEMHFADEGHGSGFPPPFPYPPPFREAGPPPPGGFSDRDN